MNEKERERLRRRALAAKKEDCPDCYERMIKMGYARPLTKEELKKYGFT